MQGVPEGCDDSSASRDLVVEINSSTDLAQLVGVVLHCPVASLTGGTDPADVQVRGQEEKGECILELRPSRKNDFGAVPP